MLGKQNIIFALLSLSAIAITGCELETVTGAPELIPFESCSQLENHVQLEAINTTRLVVEEHENGQTYEPFGFVNASTAGGSGSVEFSSTNNQEEGVHESDIVQADSTHLFTLRGDRLFIISAITANQREMETDSIIDLPGDPIEMILEGNRLVVFSRTGQSEVLSRYANVAADRPNDNPVLTALVYDVSDRSNPEMIREVSADGQFVAARRVDDKVYMVARSALASNFEVPEEEDPDEWLMRETDRIGDETFDSWMPYVYNISYENANSTPDATGGRPSCTSAYRSQTASGTSALAIVSFDVINVEVDVETTTIFGDGTLVYASTDAILLAQTNFIADEIEDPEDVAFNLEEQQEVITGAATDIHRFDLESAGARYRSSGRVPGFALNVFALDEHNDQVRVVTHEATDLDGSNLFILDDGQNQQNDPLMLGSSTSNTTMDIVGRVTEIAPTEDLFGVRFMDEFAYVVTFEQTDPLWVIDLSNSSQPRVRGELEVPGWSSYLHPISNDRLLAVGEDGEWDGDLKVSLFDVSNPDRPTAVNELVSWGYQSLALEDHRAFRYLESSQLLAVPVSGRDHRIQFYNVTSNSLTESTSFMQNVTGATAPILRSYQIGDYLYVYSTAAVSAVNLNSLLGSDTLSF